jgi:photosystem II stability/assembly factor-like uncharacterized protein
VTTDAGHTWQNRFPHGFEDQYLKAEVAHPIDADICWLLSSYAAKDIRCFRSEDAGRSWIEICRFFAKKYNIVAQDLSFANSGHGWIMFAETIGGRFYSTICRTEDKGKTWSNTLLKGPGKPEKMLFSDENTGWIIEVRSNRSKTNYTTVLNSTKDGARSWNQASVIDGRARDLCLGPNGDLFLCGANGLLAMSDNSGKNWKILTSHTRMVLETIHFRGNVGIIAGTADFIRSTRSVVFLFTSNGGRNWTRIDSPIRASIVGMYLTAWDRGVMATAEALYEFRLC